MRHLSYSIVCATSVFVLLVGCDRPATQSAKNGAVSSETKPSQRSESDAGQDDPAASSSRHIHPNDEVAPLSRYQQLAVRVRKQSLTENELLEMLFRSVPLVVSDEKSSSGSHLLMQTARLAMADRRYQDVLALTSNVSGAEAVALRLRSLAMLQRFSELARTSHPLDRTKVEAHADFWAALGWLAFELDECDQAIGAWLRCTSIDPTDTEAYQQLAVLLERSGQTPISKLASKRALQIRNTMEIAKRCRDSPRDARLRSDMSSVLLSIGRPLEAISWRELAIKMSGASANELTQIAEQRTALRSNPKLDSVLADFHRLSLHPADYPVDVDALIRKIDTIAEPPSHVSTKSVVQWVDVAKQVGLTMDYHNAVPKALSRIRLHETLGGGVAVLDFDLDGRPDLYMVQGGNAEGPNDEWSNVMYRCERIYHDVTLASSTASTRYGVGATAGDINQDGFPDLFVGNLGGNQLWINNGDGTFSERTDLISPHANVLTASVAIADVNGDDLADIVEANYVNDSQIFSQLLPRPGSGSYGVSPLHYRMACDRIHLARDDGTFEVKMLDQEGSESASSLGLMITNFDQKSGNEIFFANDMKPNHFWRLEGENHWQESAVVSGLASGHDGSVNACMGVAIADFDRDKRVDIHVSNFYEETNNLFLQQAKNSFCDYSGRYQFPQSTFHNLGFGTQVDDFNRDGWSDLLVVNGHISNDASGRIPFRMKPLVLVNQRDRFSNVTFDDSAYFDQPTLGRSLASLDWNRDGRTDFVVTHLDRPVALLENRITSAGHWICLEVVGRTSERDAIGASVWVSGDQHTSVGVVTSGDGYLCKNEPVVRFGLGNSTILREIGIEWPNGNRQSFTDVAADRRYLVVEDEPHLWQR